MGLIFFDKSLGDGAAATDVPDRINLMVTGVAPASLIIIIVGVIIFTEEIKSRTIIPTMSAASDRSSVVMAKTILTALVGAGFAVVAGGLTLLVGLVGLDQKGFSLNFDHNDFARVILGAGAFLIIATLFGLGIGLITNSTTFGITIAIIWPLALETTVKGFAPDWMAKILPFEAGSQLYAVTTGETPPWEGGAIFLGWSGLLILGGAALFNRRNLGSSG
jgi:ABC-type transport system involved in multi-copper enzyme maturation permease subunit